MFSILRVCIVRLAEFGGNPRIIDGNGDGVEVGEITNNDKRLNRQCLGWNEMRVKPCLLILKRAESVFRKNS